MEIQKKIKTHNGKGFSIVEFLVVIFIIALLTTLVLVNYRQGQQKNAVNSATQRLTADLRRAQNSALAVKTEKEGMPACGYGIYTPSANQYQLFYNTAADCNSVDKYYRTGQSQVLETINLPSGVTLDSQGPSCAADRCKSTYFEPPDPITYIANNDSGPRIFTLSVSGGYSKTITVNLSGRIDIQ